MKILIIVIFLLVVMAIIFVKYKRRDSADSVEVVWPFYVKKPLTQTEQILYHRLVNVLPDHIVLAQVQLSRILGIKQRNNFHEWNIRINRINLDFVICGKDSSIITIIEPDDKKNKALSSDEGRLVRWQVNALPDEAAIRLALVK